MGTGRIVRFARRFPFVALLLLVISPHLAGSCVNIAYNAARIEDLQEETSTAGSVVGVTEAFEELTFWYNVVVWPVCAILVVRLLAGVRPALLGQRSDSEPEEHRTRRYLLALPRRLSLVALLGWFPGVIVFPIGLWVLADCRPAAAAAHFAVNLIMSGSIAFSYSYMGVAWLLISVCYVQLWTFPGALNRETIPNEIAPVTRPLAWCRTASGAVPLLSAILIIAVSPTDISEEEYTIFRVLLTLLIAAGMLGFHFSVRLTETLDAGVRAFDQSMQ